MIYNIKNKLDEDHLKKARVNNIRHAVEFLGAHQNIKISPQSNNTLRGDISLDSNGE